MSSLQISYEEFIYKIKQLHPNVKVRSKKLGKLDLFCTACKTEFRQYSSALLKELPKCMCPKVKRQPLRIDPEEFAKEFKKNRPDLVLLSPYLGATKNVTVKSKKCGHTWQAQASGLLNDNRFHEHGIEKVCLPCSYKLRTAKGTHEQFIQDMKAKHPNIKVLDRYVGRTKSVNVVCKLDGHTWRAPPHALLGLKYACIECARRNTGYATKELTVGGRRFKVQGYEPQFLKWLYRTKRTAFKELKCGKDVPRFTYKDKSPNTGEWKDRVYRPDFYIPSLNLIIEIKSTYTAAGQKAWLKTLKRKRAAAIKAGYEFALVVMSESTKLEVADRWYARQLSAKTIASPPKPR